jgi:hypothetical protein
MNDEEYKAYRKEKDNAARRAKSVAQGKKSRGAMPPLKHADGTPFTEDEKRERHR